MEKSILISVLLGMLIYFLGRFRAAGYKWSEASIWVWIKDNYLNLITSAIAVFAWAYVNEDMNRLTGFFLGLGWNAIWDIFEKVTFKKRSSYS